MLDTTEYIRRLEKAKRKEHHDTEESHIEADEVLCDLLNNLGYKEVVELYDSIYKWHA